MPDEAVIAPAAPAQAAPTTPAAAPEAPVGIQGAMKDFDEMVKPKPPAKPDKGPEKQPDKPDGKEKAPDKPDPAKPAKPVKDDDIWEKAPPKLKAEFYKTKRQLEDKIQSHENKIKQIESQAKPTAADEKLVTEYQKQIKDMEQRIAATDYRQSVEFQKQFVDRWKGEYKKTVEEVSGLQLTIRDAEGNEKVRAATEADFQKILRLPPGEQDRVAQELFGPYANRVLARMFRLQEIERLSEEAVNEHAQKAELTAKEKQLATEKEQKQYDQVYENSANELKKHWPQYFAPDDNDPEGSAALEGGYKYVDEALAKSKDMSVDDRAAYNAVIRARAAAFPRSVLENNRLRAENESLKEELKKFRKSDPGSEGGDRGPSGNEPEGDDGVPKGIRDATAIFNG